MSAKRSMILGAALTATLAATWWASTLEDEPKLASERVREFQPAKAGRPAAASGATSRLADLEAPRRLEADSTRLFEPKSLQLPPPPPPIMPPPKPQAPPLPFKFVGAMEDGGDRAVFLLDGNQVRVVRAGEQLGGQYSVDRITPAVIEFTYLPLKQRQTLATGRP